MEILTLEKLKELKEGIFASGITDLENYWTAGKKVLSHLISNINLI